MLSNIFSRRTKVKGLFDVNGRQVCEGDTIQHINMFGDKLQATQTVEYTTHKHTGVYGYIVPVRFVILNK